MVEHNAVRQAFAGRDLIVCESTEYYIRLAWQAVQHRKL